MKWKYVFPMVLSFLAPSVRCDLLPPPSVFDGHCICSVRCDKAYVSNDPESQEMAPAMYRVQFNIPFSNQTTQGYHLCQEGAEQNRSFDAWKKGPISPKALTSQFCLNGGPEAGYCSTQDSCRPEQISCRSEKW